MTEHNSIANSPLGKHSDYVSVYTPSLLSPIPRAESRRSLGIDAAALPFSGADLWTAYELSWLNARGKPQVAAAEFRFPAESPSLVESKSLKLYLNSLNQSRFDDAEQVRNIIAADLANASGAPVEVRLMSLAEVAQAGVASCVGERVDDLDIDIDSYTLDPGLLRAAGPVVEETLYSELLKSNCPVTGQPDWGTVTLSYRGLAIDRAGLLRYIVSFREHGDFHENCVERIFVDVMARCGPEELTVSARYTRRGGLDINPFRSNCGREALSARLARQ